MKTGDWLADTSEEYFSDGPYATKEEAIEKYPSDAALEPGQEFFVGQISLWIPDIDDDHIKEHLIEVANDNCSAEIEWDLQENEGAQNLGEFLTKALHEWLTINEAWPKFGEIDSVEKYVYTPKKE